MRKTKKRFHYTILFMLFALIVFCAMKQCFAQDTGPYVAEPGSLALISTTGFCGFIIRFARRRFQDFKRCFDLFASIAGLILSFPVMVLTGLFIKIVSPGGPVLFKQERVGKDGKLFNIYKLRTMKPDAEKDTGPVWAKENDPRYIKLGKFIRKAHLDELPQLINVLKGEMSIVGPRPERLVFVEMLSREIEDYRKRLHVRPGITGLAQVRQKYDDTIEDVKRKVKFDLLYVRRMCLWVDVRILALTVIVALTGKGAR